MAYTDPRVAGQSPKYMVNIGVNMDMPQCPCPHLWLLYPKYPPQPWLHLSHLICFWLLAVLTFLPSLSTLCSLLTCVSICASNQTSLSSGCCWEGFVGDVLCDNSIFLAILVPHYPSTALFKNLCLGPFQAVCS